MKEQIDNYGEKRVLSPEMAAARIEVRAREYAVAHLIDVGEPENSRVNVDERVDMGGKVIQVAMHRAVWGRSSEGVLKVEWPANWWQHFKQRFYPRWALKFWPVLMEKQAYDAMTFAPELVIRDPDANMRRYATISVIYPSKG